MSLKGNRANGRIAIFGTLNVMVASAVLVAMSVVCGKYLAIGVGEVLRFSLENLPIILAGILFGPAVGAVVGCVADLVGCVLVGYAVNPLVTLGAVAIGLLSGGCYKLLLRIERLGHGVRVGICVAVAHIFGSVLIKTVGLAAFYDMPFALLIVWRTLNYAIIGALEFTLAYFITKNRSLMSVLERSKK